MKLKLPTAVVVAVTFTAPFLVAQEMDSETAQRMCSSKGEPNPARSWCQGFFTGATKMGQVWGSLSDRPPFCISWKISPAQAEKVWSEYLLQDPVHLSQLPEQSFFYAMKEAFPCDHP